MIIAKKSLGQHWLDDKASLEVMCDSAQITDGDTVLEIGPGKGTLTASLLDHGASVIGVELDPRLAVVLQERFKNKPFTLNMLSILDFDFTRLPDSYKLVANIPYYITGHLLRQLTETPRKPSMAVLLLQKEVTLRVAAEPGDMSVISIAIQMYYEVEAGFVIPAKLFTPPPKVDSQILILRVREEPLFPITDMPKFFWIVKAGFSEKRKKLRSSLSGGLQISKTEVEQLLSKAQINLDARAQELSLREWFDLYNSILKS